MSPRDEDRLYGVHPDLVAVVRSAFDRWHDSPQNEGAKVFVIEGVRDAERQLKLLRIGASRTRNSRHLTGHAVDLGLQIDGRMIWEFPAYQRLWEVAVKPAADDLGVEVHWGGYWTRLRDGPHFELSRNRYPATPIKEMQA